MRKHCFFIVFTIIAISSLIGNNTFAIYGDENEESNDLFKRGEVGRLRNDNVACDNKLEDLFPELYLEPLDINRSRDEIDTNVFMETNKLLNALSPGIKRASLFFLPFGNGIPCINPWTSACVRTDDMTCKWIINTKSLESGTSEVLPWSVVSEK